MSLIVDALLRALEPMSLLAIFIGTLLGIIFGALPGFTATMGVALLLPVTFGMKPVPALLMLTSIYGGAIYGGCIPAILVHTPGTPASAATALDGYELTKKGLGGKAIGVATISSAIGGLISVWALLLLAPPLSRLSLKFGPPEYFLLAVFGLSIIGSLASKAMLKGLISAAFGLLLATIGIDIITGAYRFTFGSLWLEGGIPLVPALIGLFSLSQVLLVVEESKSHIVSVEDLGDQRILPTIQELRELMGTILYSSVIGVLIGILPGAGGSIASWVGYNEAKRISKTPEKFGTGHMAGVAAPEAANNAVTGGALVPLLTLGIPGSGVAAVLLGGLIIQGLVPGRQLFTKYADITYAVIVGLFFANIMMLIIGLLGARYAFKVSLIPVHTLFPVIVVLCVMGSFAVNNSLFDVGLMIFFGFLGYLMRKHGFAPAPMTLGLILGPMAEEGFRQSLALSKGAMIPYFLGRPVCVVLMLLIGAALVVPLVLARSNKGSVSG
ncbi:MAG: tripartite tricarboxylate transporter permease [Limnochordia bacterium]|jgi:putative tricarboxylic transport membrane protein